LSLSLFASTASTCSNEPAQQQQKQQQLRCYEYNDNGHIYKLSYRYQPASPGYENCDPLLLIHPIGIGLASWFYKYLMEEFHSNNNGPAFYAVNLLGCGQTEGSATLDLTEKGLFVPLTWVRHCETLIDTVILPEQQQQRQQSKSLGLLFGRWTGKETSVSSSRGGVTVMSQGGLAPVAILLAARNKSERINHLVLSAPPSGDEILSAVPERELALNFNFLSGWTGQIAFQYALETEWAVRFFSNLFLFDQPCTSEWVDTALHEAGPKVRMPVALFNSGFCQSRSYEPELRNGIKCPCLVLQGQADSRDRAKYQALMGDDFCNIVTIPGKNVLPWESPKETAAALRAFLKLNDNDD